MTAEPDRDAADVGTGRPPAAGPSRAPHVAPAFRPRLVLVGFATLIVALTMLATLAYLLTRQDLRRTELADAAQQTRTALAGTEPPRTGDAAALTAYVVELDRLGAFAVEARSPVAHATSPGVPVIAASLPVPPVGSVRAFGPLDAEDAHVVAVTARPRDDLVVTAYFSQDRADALLRSLRGRLIAVGVLLTGVLGAAAAVVVQRLVRPVDLARRTAQRLAAGELGARLPATGREFDDLTLAFNTMAAELESTIARLRHLEAVQRRFVANVSHDLRTPVTALTTAAGLLEPALDDLPTAPRRAGVLLVAEVARLRVLVEDLMEISRLDAGQAVVETETVPVREHVIAVAAHLGLEAELGAGIVLTVDDDLTVDTDRRRLGAILRNLLANAVQHGARPIEVRADAAGDTVEIVVRDHGPGVDPHHLANLFERFYRSDESRQRHGGSGLGLSIAHEQALVLGGTLTIDNAPGGGFAATLRLPATG